MEFCVTVLAHFGYTCMCFADGSLENGIVRPQMYQPVSALQVEFILTLSAMLLKKQLI